jgi:hypothetical protein
MSCCRRPLPLRIETLRDGLRLSATVESVRNQRRSRAGDELLVCNRPRPHRKPQHRTPYSANTSHRFTNKASSLPAGSDAARRNTRPPRFTGPSIVIGPLPAAQLARICIPPESIAMP